jgi:hypothetical protein
MEKLPEKRRPLEADCPKYLDIDTDADDELFEEDWDAEHVRALEDELYTRHGDEIEAERTRQRLADEAQVSRFPLCARATSTPDRELEQRRPAATAPEASAPAETSRKIAFARSQTAAEGGQDKTLSYKTRR